MAGGAASAITAGDAIPVRLVEDVILVMARDAAPVVTSLARSAGDATLATASPALIVSKSSPFLWVLGDVVGPVPACSAVTAALATPVLSTPPKGCVNWDYQFTQPGPGECRCHIMMITLIRVAHPHPTSVHNIPDRRVQRYTVKVTLQITVTVAGNISISDHPDPCTQAHVSKSPSGQCLQFCCEHRLVLSVPSGSSLKFSSIICQPPRRSIMVSDR